MTKAPDITIKLTHTVYDSGKTLRHWHVYVDGRFAGIHGRKHSVLAALQGMGLPLTRATLLVENASS
jgi:hypothetical protein